MATLDSVKLLRRLVFLLIYSCIHQVASDKISDQRLCADRTCETLISKARTLARHKPTDPAFLGFDRGEIISIYSKSSGSRLDLWGGELNGKRGYFPRSFVREYKVEVPNPQFTVETEKHIPLEDRMRGKTKQAEALTPVQTPESNKKPPEEHNKQNDEVKPDTEAPSGKTDTNKGDDQIPSTEPDKGKEEKVKAVVDDTEIDEDTEVDETDIAEEEPEDPKIVEDPAEEVQPDVGKTDAEEIKVVEPAATKTDEEQLNESDETDIDETDIEEEEEENADTEADETDLDDMDFDEEAEEERDLTTAAVEETKPQTTDDNPENAPKAGSESMKETIISDRNVDEKVADQTEEKKDQVDVKDSDTKKSETADGTHTEVEEATEVVPETDETETDETEVQDDGEKKEEEDADGSLFGSMFSDEKSNLDSSDQEVNTVDGLQDSAVIIPKHADEYTDHTSEEPRETLEQLVDGKYGNEDNNDEELEEEEDDDEEVEEEDFEDILNELNIVDHNSDFDDTSSEKEDNESSDDSLGETEQKTNVKKDYYESDHLNKQDIASAVDSTSELHNNIEIETKDISDIHVDLKVPVQSHLLNTGTENDIDEYLKTLNKSPDANEDTPDSVGEYQTETLESTPGKDIHRRDDKMEPNDREKPLSMGMRMEEAIKNISVGNVVSQIEGILQQADGLMQNLDANKNGDKDRLEPDLVVLNKELNVQKQPYLKGKHSHTSEGLKTTDGGSEKLISKAAEVLPEPKSSANVDVDDIYTNDVENLHQKDVGEQSAAVFGKTEETGEEKPKEEKPGKMEPENADLPDSSGDLQADSALKDASVDTQLTEGQVEEEATLSEDKVKDKEAQEERTVDDEETDDDLKFVGGEGVTDEDIKQETELDSMAKSVEEMKIGEKKEAFQTDDSSISMEDEHHAAPASADKISPSVSVETTVASSTIQQESVLPSSSIEPSQIEETVVPKFDESFLQSSVMSVPVPQETEVYLSTTPALDSHTDRLVIDGTVLPVEETQAADEHTSDKSGYVVDGTTFPPEFFGDSDTTGTTPTLDAFPSTSFIQPTLSQSPETTMIPQQTLQPTSTETLASIAESSYQVTEVSTIVESATDTTSVSDIDIQTTATLKDELLPATPKVLGTSFSFASESRDDSSTTQIDSVITSLLESETMSDRENVSVSSDMVQEQVQPSMEQGVYLTDNFLSRKPLSTGTAGSQSQGSDATTQTTDAPGSQTTDAPGKQPETETGDTAAGNKQYNERSQPEEPTQDNQVPPIHDHQQQHGQQQEQQQTVSSTPPAPADPYGSDSILSKKVPDPGLDEEQKGSGVTTMLQSLEPMLKSVIYVLPPSVQSLLEQEPLGLSPSVTVGVALLSSGLLILITCLSCLCKGEKKSAKVEALEIIRKLEDQLFINTKEKENLEDDLQMKNKKIEELEEDVHSHRSTSGSVETEISTVRLHNEALKKQVSALQQEVTDYQHEVGEKKRDIKDKVEKVRHHEAETRELENKVADVESLLEKTSESLSEKISALETATSQVESLTQQVQLLETRRSQLDEESSVWSERVKELSDQVEQHTEEARRMQEDLAFKENELEVLRDCFLQVKAFQGEDEMKEEPDENTDLSDKLKSMMDVSRTNATLRSVEEERDILKNKLQIEVDSRKEMEDQIEQLKRKIESNQTDKMKSDRQSQDAQTRLEVLSKYFKEREAELTKQLGEQEVLKNQNITKLQSSDTITVELQKENEAYKVQVDDLKNEISKAERDFRSQIAANEKKAHESWLSTRAAERECKEARHECGMLRQKLTDLERKLMQAPPPGLIRPITRRGAPPPGMLNGPPPPPPPERPGSRGDDEYRNSPGPDRMPPPPDRRGPPGGMGPRPPPPHGIPQSPPPYAIRPPFPPDRRSPPPFDRYPPPTRGPRPPPPPGSRFPPPPHLRSPPLSGPPSEHEDPRMGPYPHPPGSRDRTHPQRHQSHV